MDGLGYKDYFLQPAEGWQRRDEALRCVLVEEQPMKPVVGSWCISTAAATTQFRRKRRSTRPGHGFPGWRITAWSLCTHE